ncbi:hypothetical protein V5O48_014527 [Marasmius crinis-equi]|uniref:Uncharacterized protein n=1 Tax=Marasmius crinis-equi TaxID=585013 RepID=A0ABR3EX02_9AGAR
MDGYQEYLYALGTPLPALAGFPSSLRADGETVPPQTKPPSPNVILKRLYANLSDDDNAEFLENSDVPRIELFLSLKTIPTRNWRVGAHMPHALLVLSPHTPSPILNLLILPLFSLQSPAIPHTPRLQRSTPTPTSGHTFTANPTQSRRRSESWMMSNGTQTGNNGTTFLSSNEI